MKISKMADFHFFQQLQGTADILLFELELDMSCSLKFCHIPQNFLDLSKQFKQNTCNIQFIESLYLECGIL